MNMQQKASSLYLIKRRIINELQWKRIVLNETYDKLIRDIVWHMPKRIVMWCCYRVAANATQGEWGNVSPADLKFFDMMDRWK